MKHFRLITAAFIASVLSGAMNAVAETPDSVWIYLYTNLVKDNHDGMHWAWSPDLRHWVNPSPEQKLVSSDYGTWGSQKRMLSPFMTKGPEDTWYALWSINESEPAIAIATTEDFIDWRPQSYPVIGRKGKNCIDPELSYDAATSTYKITWLETDGSSQPVVISTSTQDFQTYTPAVKASQSERLNTRKSIEEVSPISNGTIHRISRSHLRQLVRNAEAENYRNLLNSETTANVVERFAGLQPQNLTLTIGTSQSYPISDKLIGIFFEDISRAADGGLYAELIENRDFEYSPTDIGWNDPDWNSTHSWTLDGAGAEISISTDNPIHPNNPHYASLKITSSGVSLSNDGFNGIALKKGEKYDLSMFTRSNKVGKLNIALKNKDGKVLASASIKPSSGKWGKNRVTLVAADNASDARLVIEPVGVGEIDIDMVSLFPQNTFHGRRNGLRRDLADTIAAMHPRFIRFPGGCVAHGDGIDNIYRWKNSIGPLESRKPMRNIWNYHQSLGLGYHEYFEFCEDLNAEPVPVLAAGVPCQNSSHGGYGQQGGIPMSEMDEYTQDILDLIEYANGDAKTTEWGRKRAENGHPAPFNLKYIGIGNEDLISDVFKERFKYIYDTVKEKHPEITVIGTAGPFHSGSDYDEGWKFATELDLPLVDEHYYSSPGWFINNQHYYDGYDRSRPHVYLGEYASWGNNLLNALVEAAYLCNVERNGDVVEMTSYAPLLAKEGQTSWNPDLIYFTNAEVHPTVNYRVQRLFGENQGTSYVPSSLSKIENPAAAKRVAYSVVDNPEGGYIIKMANILPVSTTVDIKLPEGDNFENVKTETLSGDPESSSDYTLTSATLKGSALTLPPYSFVVAKIGK